MTYNSTKKLTRKPRDLSHDESTDLMILCLRFKDEIVKCSALICVFDLEENKQINNMRQAFITFSFV